MRGLQLLALGMLAIPLPAAAAPDWSQAQTVTVRMLDDRFVPDRLTFRHGVVYRLHLENAGRELHEFTAPDFLAAIEKKNPEVIGSYGAEIVLEPGQQKDLYFVAPAAARYKLTCSDHEWDGMIGEIVVE
jgi:uncharacterized cupredoxin-like copper-binding protein